MSFILDAIKKSESERKQSRYGRLHSLQDQLQSRGENERRSKRLVLLMWSLLLLLSLFSWWRADISLDDLFGDLLFPAFEVEPISVTSVRENIKGATPEPRSSERTVRQPGQLRELPPRNEIKELWQLPADFQSMIPKLEFSFHVYSLEPLKRTIIINGRRVREGQLVASGLTLRSITESGVIMQHRDRIFHVDVIEKW